MTRYIEGQDDPVELDFTIRRGGDWRVTIDWTNDSGQPIDPAGITMSLHWERSALSGVFPPDLISSLDASGQPQGITLLPGVVQFDLTKEQTSDLDFVSTRWQIYKTGPDGRDMLWGYGRARLVGRI